MDVVSSASEPFKSARAAIVLKREARKRPFLSLNRAWPAHLAISGSEIHG
jgi:hypothetical protein